MTSGGKFMTNGCIAPQTAQSLRSLAPSKRNYFVSYGSLFPDTSNKLICCIVLQFLSGNIDHPRAATRIPSLPIMSNDGGNLFDMAKDGTTVPEDAAKPRIIPSKPRPDQIASKRDPNTLGATNLADAADSAQDIPRVGSTDYTCCTVC